MSIHVNFFSYVIIKQAIDILFALKVKKEISIGKANPFNKWNS